MKQLIFLILCSLIVISSGAQTPGFMGKKLMIGASFECGSINFGGEPASATSVFDPTKDLNHFGWSLHKFVKLSADMVITTHKSLAVAYSSGSMGLSSIYVDPMTSDEINILTKLSVKTIDLGIKYHIRSNIAPLGTYLTYGLSYNSVMETDPENSWGKVNMPFTSSKAAFNSIFYGMGINYIFKNIVVISPYFEARLTNPLPFLGNLVDGWVDGDLKRRAQARWQKSVYLNYGIGLGVLLF